MRNYRKYTRRNLSKRRLPQFSATVWLILINIIIFFVFYFYMLANPAILDYIALKPDDILQGKYLWTIFTHMFMHGGPFHLIINMFVLFSLGSFMERVIGRKRFLLFYLVSGVIAGLLSVLLSGFFGASEIGMRIFGDPSLPAVGASGAIFAIAGLFVILLPRVRFSIIFFPFFSLPGYIMIPVVLVVFWILSAVGGLPIGNVAHAGGFLAGLVYGLYLKQRYAKKIKVLRRYFQ